MTVVLPQQNRGPGALDSGWIDFSATAGPHARYTFTALMDAAALADTSLTLSNITLSVADTAGGANARVLWGPGEWVGGTLDRNGDPWPPSVFWQGDEERVFLRGTVTLSKRISFGVDMSVTAP